MIPKKRVDIIILLQMFNSYVLIRQKKTAGSYIIAIIKARANFLK